MLIQERQIHHSFVRDLVAISSLPELWAHRTPMEIITGLAGVLFNTLHLEMVYVRLAPWQEKGRLEVAYSDNGNLGNQRAQEIGARLEPFLLQHELHWSSISIANPLEEGSLQAFLIPIGLGGAQGHVVAAARELSFPEESQRLLIRIVVNQAAVMLRQKQVEEDLRRKQEELTDFFENASEGLHWVGPDGTILWANQAELAMLGYTREEYIGHKFNEFHADEVIAEDILQRLFNDQPVYEYEARLRCKDGSVRHVLISSTVYRENGNFIHTRCFTRDITERKQMEDLLRRAYDETEMRVQFRTQELSAAIEALKEEIASRQRAEAEVTELRRRLAESRESERLFLAQELHDGPIQDLFALFYSLTAEAGAPQAPQLKPVQDGIMQVISTLRKLCEELRPSTLISHGLGKAIESHLEQFKQQYPKYEVKLELGKDSVLPERINLALYRIYQQALANVVRHAQADRIVVRFQTRDGQAILEVEDNGRGFTVPTNWIDFAREGHFGLIGGFERAEVVGGKLSVNSTPGRGTRIQVRVPVNGPG